LFIGFIQLDYNLKQFNKEIDDFVKTIPDQAVAIQKKIVLDALTRIVLRTPVDTGRARGNWQVSIGAPIKDIIDDPRWKKKRESKSFQSRMKSRRSSDSKVINKANGILSKLPPYQQVWISNNLNYIEGLEKGNSKQAPKGMVSITVEELRMIFQ